MKPDWGDSPDWANYLSLDEFGLYEWHALRPYWARKFGRWLSKGGVDIAGREQSDPYFEQRP